MHITWWRHPIRTSSASLAICTVDSPVTGEFPSQRPVTRSFDAFYLRLDKWLIKQSRRRWYETPSRSLSCHYNVHFSNQNKQWLYLFLNPIMMYISHCWSRELNMEPTTLTLCVQYEQNGGKIQNAKKRWYAWNTMMTPWNGNISRVTDPLCG